MMPEKKGIDVSSWQREIQWDKVKHVGIEFAMIRVAAGSYLDRQFEKNITAALAQGIDCGVYLYSVAQTVPQALAEAKLTLERIKPYRLLLPVTFDIEDKAQHALTNTQRTDLVQAYCDTVGSAGYRPMVYASLSWFRSMLELPRLAAYENWVAQWDVQECSFDGPLHMWQYSSKGRVDGIVGDVDLNLSYQVPRTPKPAQTAPVLLPASALVAGKKLALVNAPLYASAAIGVPSGKLTGSYWVYDGIQQNGRLRVTNSSKNVNKKPIGSAVTGYISMKDAKA